MIRLKSQHHLWPAACAATALLLGTGAGMATVGGLRQNSYGSTALSSFRADARLGSAPSTADDEGYGAERCDQCSERERGYRWAVLATVRFPEQCPGDSWGFRRGCLDFVGGS